MTTLYELIRKYSWTQVWDRMLKLYPDQDQNEQGYENVWSTLQLLSPDYSEPMRISVRMIKTDIDYFDKETKEFVYKDLPEDEQWIDVCGLKLLSQDDLRKEAEDGHPVIQMADIDEYPDGYEISYAMEFTRWEKWLGSPIDESSFEEFSELDVIVCSLWEMTFCGYEQEPIQERIEQMHEVVKGIKEGTVKTKTFDTVAEMYKDLTGEDLYDDDEEDVV